METPNTTEEKSTFIAPLIFTMANFNDSRNISLFGEDSDVKPYMIVKKEPVGQIGSGEIGALETYQEVCDFILNRGSIKIGTIRIELSGPVDSNYYIRFSRVMISGEVKSFVMPLTAFFFVNQFLPNILHLELPKALLLDGKTTIEVFPTNLQKRDMIKAYFYPTKINSAPASDFNSGDTSFLEFIDSGSLFYDYVKVYNHSKYTTDFNLYFGENGVTTNIKKDELILESNKRPYSPGDKFFIWSIAGPTELITEPLTVNQAYLKPGEYDQIRPLIFPNQYATNFVTNVDNNPRELFVGNNHYPVYGYSLPPKGSVCFFVHKNWKFEEKPTNNVFQSRSVLDTETKVS